MFYSQLNHIRKKPVRYRWHVIANMNYRKISSIRHTHVGNKVVDHSDVAEALPVGAAPTTSSLLTPGFNGLGKDNSKTRRETFKFWDLVRLILEIWRYQFL